MPSVSALRTNGAPCDCAKCKGCCEEVPGWFTPAEAVKAIEAGYAKRISAVLEVPTRVVALVPSVVGAEGLAVTFSPGRCNFLSQEGKCEIHDSGFKPIECRTGYGCRPTPEYPSLHVMYDLWRSSEGLKAIALWQEKVA